MSKLQIFFLDVSWITKVIFLVPLLHHRPLQYFQVHSYALLYFPTGCFGSLPVTCPRPNVVLIFSTVLPLTPHSYPFPSYSCGRRHHDHHYPALTSCSIAESSGDLTVNIGIIVFLPRTLCLWGGDCS